MAQKVTRDREDNPRKLVVKKLPTIIKTMKDGDLSGLMKAAQEEWAARRAEQRRGAARAILIGELLRINFGDSHLKNELKETLTVLGYEDFHITRPSLKQCYLDISKQMSRLNSKESIRTASEHRFEKLFKAHSRLQLLPSVWIGNRQLDFLIPNICNPGSIGVAIEIDGGIHNIEQKMKKDADKINFLARQLRTPVFSLENSSISEARVKQLCDQLNNQRQPDTRSQRNWWQRIEIATVSILTERAANDLTVQQVYKQLVPFNLDNEMRLTEIIAKRKPQHFERIMKLWGALK